MPEQKFQNRQIAYKVRIKDILDSKYVMTEGFNPNYLEVNGKEISRVNVIGVIVQKSVIDNNKTLTIEDGSGKISARTFENNLLLDNVDVGDIVLLIGRPREFSSEKYLLVEIIKNVASLWAKLRKLELEKNIKEATVYSNKDGFKEEKIIDDGSKNKILKLIKEHDKGEGISVEDIPSTDVKDVDKIISVLLKEGDVFEIKPGKLKVLE